jgi:putative ABC transport system permease protein
MFSIAAVTATAIMTVLTMRGTYESLYSARESYYQTSRFPDVWASLERAPESVKSQLLQIEGVSAVDTRITFASTLDLENRTSPAIGRFYSASPPDEMLGALHLRSGRWVKDSDRDQVMVSEKFALANHFADGDTLRAIINGRLRHLEIVATAISPEHSYAVPQGSLFPDDEQYGVLWMSPKAMGAAYNMEGAFNEVALTISSRVDIRFVQSEVDRILKPYGGLGSYTRQTQLSNLFLESELNSNKQTGTIIPGIFLAVVAFLLNIVMRRLISTQRQEIAVLKAFGYTNMDVGLFYLKFALSAVMAGAVVGMVSGVWLGGLMIDVYRDYFDFPDLTYHLSPSLLVFAVAVSSIAAVVGALGGVRGAIRLPPAEAMRPQSPARFTKGLLEHFAFFKRLPSAMRMVVRNIERRPLKTIFSAVGVAFSVAILVIGLFLFDGMYYMMDLQFNVAQREDLTVTFNKALPERIRYDLGRIEGVNRIEFNRMVPVRITKGALKREMAITGRKVGDELNRIVHSDGIIIPLPLHGLVVSQILADQLHLKRGDSVQVEILEGERRKESVPIVGIVEDFLGMNAYMHMESLNDLVRGPRLVTGANLSVMGDNQDDVAKTLSTIPMVASVSSPRRGFELFKKQMSEGLMVSMFFLIGFSSIISVAVIYNGARISLSERGRELASLRVLGFSKKEVSVLLFSEQAVITLCSIPIGWYIGKVLAGVSISQMASESYRFPFVVDWETYAFSAIITIIAAIGSSLIVRRRLNNYDLISVLKTRD